MPEKKLFDLSQNLLPLNIEIKKGKLKNINKYLDIFDECKHDNYISHGEVICGRATSELKWAGNIIQQMKQEFIYCIINNKYEVFEILLSDVLIGFTIIETNKKSKSAVLSDIMIKKDYQGKGIGKKVLQKIEEYLKNKNIGIVLLESGIKNENVHHFFEKNGYKRISIVYSKNL